MIETTFDKYNKINLDDYNLVPDLNTSPEFGVFADELRPLIQEATELPFGCLSIIVYGMQDIMRGLEFDVPEYLQPIMMKVYYLLAGALLTKQNTDLIITKKDIQKMNKIVQKIIGVIILIELYYKKKIDIVLIDGFWHIKGGDKLIEEAEKDIEKLIRSVDK